MALPFDSTPQTPYSDPRAALHGGALSQMRPPSGPGGPQMAPQGGPPLGGGMGSPGPQMPPTGSPGPPAPPPPGKPGNEGLINRVLTLIRQGTAPPGGTPPGALGDIEQLLEQSGLSRSSRSGGMGSSSHDRPIPMGQPPGFARGSYVESDGSGNGRSDHVEARLSPGEFVVDAETVALLGDGDNEAGARKLEEMRQGIRRQKGKALAQGRFSPDARDPEDYVG